MAVYLLHSTVPIGGPGRNGARHYTGFCREGRLAERLREHRSGRGGVAIVNAYLEAGGDLLVGGYWPGEKRADERRRKNGGNSRKACLVCRGLAPLDPDWHSDV